MSPWASRKQARWGNSPAGRKALGAAKVDEYNKATKWVGKLGWGKKKRSKTKKRRAKRVNEHGRAG